MGKLTLCGCLSAVVWTLVPGGPAAAVAPGPFPEPVVTVTLAPVNELSEHVREFFRLTTSRDAPPELQQVWQIAAQIEGLSRSRPLGAALFAPRAGTKHPRWLVCLPVASIERLQRTLNAARDLDLQPTSENRYQLRINRRALFAQLESSYLIVTATPELLDTRLQDGLALLDLTTDAPPGFHLLTFRYHQQGLSQERRQAIANRVLARLDRAIAQQPSDGTPAVILQRRGLELGRSVVQTLFDDVTQFSLRVGSRRAGEATTVELRVAAREGSSLSEFAASLPISPTLPLVGDPALVVQANLQMPAAMQDVLRRGLRHVEEETLEPLRDGGSPWLDVVKTVHAALVQLVDRGRLELLAGFVRAPNEFLAAVAGISTTEADEIVETFNVRLAAVSPRLAAYVRHDDPWHVAPGIPVKPKDQPLYGPVGTLLLGAPGDTLWLAFGPPGTPDILTSAYPQRTNAGKAAPPIGPGPRPILAVDLHMIAWLPIILGQKDQLSEEDLIMQQSFRDPRDDGLQAAVYADEEGLRVSMTLERDWLRFLGAHLERRTAREGP